MNYQFTHSANTIFLFKISHETIKIKQTFYKETANKAVTEVSYILTCFSSSLITYKSAWSIITYLNTIFYSSVHTETPGLSFLFVACMELLLNYLLFSNIKLLILSRYKHLSASFCLLVYLCLNIYTKHII